MDIVLIRENTEDLYAGLEHTVVPGVVESLKIITEKASTRVAKFAFEFARKYGRKKIHAIHKANIMKLSDGLFLTSVRKVAENYPDIEYKELIVDNACMQMVINPHQFDMLLLTNLYGDIMSDLAAGLVGGLGVVPSGNMGEKVAIFEAVHGTAPDIAGKGIANPTALLMSAILMLRHVEEMGAASRIEDALHRVYREGKTFDARCGWDGVYCGVYGGGDWGVCVRARKSKDLTQRRQRKGGEKSEKDNCFYRGDAECAEKGDVLHVVDIVASWGAARSAPTLADAWKRG